MTWICERCHCTYEGSFPDKIEARRDSDLMQLCVSAVLYIYYGPEFFKEELEDSGMNITRLIKKLI